MADSLPASVTILRDKESGALSILGGPWCPTASHEYATYRREPAPAEECAPHDIEDISDGRGFVNVGQCKRCGAIFALHHGGGF